MLKTILEYSTNTLYAAYNLLKSAYNYFYQANTKDIKDPKSEKNVL